MTTSVQAIGSSDRKSEKLYARLESPFEFKDYQRRGRCVRLLGITEHEFGFLEQRDEVRVQTIDVSYWRFCDLTHIGRRSLQRNQDAIDGVVDNDAQFQADWYEKWYELTVEWRDKGGDGYAYPSFGEEEPKYFDLVSISPQETGPSLPEPPQNGPLKYTPLAQIECPQSPNSNPAPAWRLYAYHVGQGMCSLLTNGIEGWLFDAGAGTPILRQDYLNGLSRNDLLEDIKPLSSINMVLSHADQDHWRLLGWGNYLSAKVSEIIVPDGAKSLIYKDKKIQGKCRKSTGFKVNLVNGGVLVVLRSSPAQSNDNSQCLVSIYKSASGAVLLSGDYVYSGVANDGCSDVSALASQAFAAIIVPHHGDLASANNVFLPQNPIAAAFFSAGDHRLYRHPRVESIEAHISAGFQVIRPLNTSVIKRVQLI